MRTMHIMFRKNSETHRRCAPKLTAGAAAGPTTGLGARIEAMRASGMSATAVRRVLALSAAEAMACGLLAPACAKAPAGGPAGASAQVGGPAGALAQLGGPAGALAQAGPDMIEVVDAVARACGLGREDLLGRGQARPLARARHLAMYLVRELCPGASLPAIGYLLERDHTTVLYGCRRAAALLARDAGIRALCARLRGELAP
jgi:hypothetical protein